MEYNFKNPNTPKPYIVKPQPISAIFLLPNKNKKTRF